MALTLDTFQNLAASTRFARRDIVVGGENEAATARLGNFVFSSGRETNKATMSAFRAALEAEYGVFGTHAFDMTLTSRKQLGKSLRASDVTKTISQIGFAKRQRWVSEMNRQLDMDPTVWSLSREVRHELRERLYANPFGDPPAKLWTIRTQKELAQEVSKVIRLAIIPATAAVDAKSGDIATANPTRESTNAPDMANDAVRPDEPTGLRNFNANPVFGGHYTSMEDRMKAGRVGTGLRVNRNVWRPVVLEGLKTNGVEPGFIYRNDWSLDDTNGLMADLWSEENVAALDALVNGNAELRAMRDANPPATRRELAMKAGRSFPAGMAAVAEFVLERELGVRNSPIARAFGKMFPGVNPAGLFPAGGNAPGAETKRLLADVKKALFIEIRDAIMNEPQDNPDFAKSPIFDHFADHNIVKLDYNEGDRNFGGSSGSAGGFRLPERVTTKFGTLKGWAYRNFRLTTADAASIGAVREALANDITRILGVPAQELSIVRGQYSDGHPKLMLTAKFAKGYRDLEDGFLQDGQAVAPPGEEAVEPLGRYKAIFLALADRDTIGSHGQNKGLVNGRFFAIDPGHSLEGNGNDLEISDDLSFKDRGAGSQVKRFCNFSVFDDDTRFAKFQGVLKLRELSQSNRLDALFASYRTQFDPNEEGIGREEVALRRRIIDSINAMADELRSQINKILVVFGPQLAAFDALAPNPPHDGEPTRLQADAIETIGNLEKLTSPTRWTSPNGTVDLKHLAVEPRTRVPWKLTVRSNGDLAYTTDARLDDASRNRLLDFCQRGGAAAAVNANGGMLVVVPAESREAFFAAMSERNIIDEKHADELPGRVAREIERGRLAAEELTRRAQNAGAIPAAPQA